MTKHEAAQAYLRDPVNFGPESKSVTAAEYDAFIAGWEASTRARIRENYPPEEW